MSDATPKHPQLAYIGVAGLLLVPIALLHPAQRARVALFATLGALAIGVALTVHTPVFAVFRQLPTGSWFRVPDRILFLWAFCGSALAAIGVDAVARGWADRRMRIAALGGPVALAVCVGLAAPPSTATLAIGVATFAAIAVAVFAPPGARRFAVPALVAILGLDLAYASVNRHAHPIHRTAPSAAQQAAYTDLAARQEHGRALLYSRFAIDLGVAAKYGTAQRIFTVNDYEPLTLARYGAFFRLLDASPPERFDRRPFDGRVKLATTPRALRLLDLLSFRFLAARPGDAPLLRAMAETYGRWDLRFGSDEAGGLRVFENPDPLPRAYVAEHWQQAAGPAEALARIGAPGFDPRSAVVVERAPPGLAPRPAAPIAPARIVEYRAHEVVVEARAPRGGLLVLNDTFYPGWEATVDGVEAPIVRANYLFRGVPVPPGEHRVRFRYAPTSFRAGLAAFACAGVACAALLWLGRGGRAGGAA